MTAFIATLIFIATLAAHPDQPLVQEVPDKKIVTHRPYHLTGTLNISGQTFEYGSGGNGASIPYGDHPITPADVGDWGKRHKAIGLAGGTIYDPQLGRDREGIEIHGANHLESAGCLVVMQDNFDALKQAIFDMLKSSGHAFLHIHPDGVSITPEQNFQSAFVYIAQKEDVERSDHHRQHRHYAERHHHHEHIAQHHHRHYAHRSRYASR